MKKLILFILLSYTTLSMNATVVLSSAGGTTFQTGVPFSLDLTFSNLPTTCAITHVKISYSATFSPTCVPNTSVKIMGGTYWGSGVGTNPSLLTIPIGGAPFPISSNMLPIFTGLSANSIINILTENGSIPNGTAITITATANYFNSTSAALPCATETATPVTITITAQKNITAVLNTTCASAAMGGFQIFNCTLNSPNTPGSLSLYSSTPNLTFNYPSCLSVFNVYDESWTPVAYTISPGTVMLNTGNITVATSPIVKIFRVVLTYPCPGVSPCLAGSNIATSFNVTGNNVCGSPLTITSSPVVNCILTGVCPTIPPGPPIPQITSSLSNTSMILCPGACLLSNRIKINNPTTSSYPNSVVEYTMPNTTNLTSMQFSPALAAPVTLSFTYSGGIGCTYTHANILVPSGTTYFAIPSAVNPPTTSTCLNKTIKLSLSTPMITPFSTQDVLFNYNVAASAPSSGFANFPLTFSSTALSGPIDIPLNVPYVNCTPVVSFSKRIISGLNCVISEYYNPSELVTYRLDVRTTSTTPITNMIINDIVNSNLIIDPSAGIKFYKGPVYTCSLTSSPVLSSSTSAPYNFATSIAGNSISASINTNQITVTSPSLSGSTSCGTYDYFTIEFKAIIKPGTPVGTYPNSASLSGSNLTMLYSNQVYASVNSYFELTAKMKVKRHGGIFTNNLTTCVCDASTNAAINKITYKGELTNVGNVTINNIYIHQSKPKGFDLSFANCGLPAARGTAASVTGLSSYNHAFNLPNFYSLVPSNFSTSLNSGFTYSGGPVTSGTITSHYFSGGSPTFEAPQTYLCASCPTCAPVITTTTPVNYGSALYVVNANTGGPVGINLNGGETISFQINPVCIQSVPSGTILKNDFSFRAKRLDLNILTDVIKSNTTTVTVNTTGCSSKGCDSSRRIWKSGVPGAYYGYVICNLSGAPVHKIKLDLLPSTGGCFPAAYSYTMNLPTALAPGACTTIWNGLAGFPNILSPFTCVSNFKVTLYSLTSVGPPAIYDSCFTGYGGPSPVRLDNPNSDPLSNESISVYPIPANDYLMVNTSNYFNELSIGSPKYNFMIYDVSGKLILNSTCVSELEQISLRGISSGLYFYKIVYNENVIKYAKFLKD